MKKFFTQPKINAAIWPTSHFSAAILCRSLQWENAQSIIEFGPGLGALTDTILSYKKKDAKYLGIEYDTTYTEFLRNRFTQHDVSFIQDTVANLENILSRYMIQRPDILISSLPNTIFEQNPNLVKSINNYVQQGMQFRVITYLPYTFSKKFKTISPKIYDFTCLNIPPCFICGVN